MNLLGYFHKHPSVSTDTRKIKVGDIFFALRGEHFNGNKFAQKALDEGAAYVVVDDPDFHNAADERFILVENSLKSLQVLATARRKELKVPILGLTGSNGKTTTKELIASVLETEKKVFATAGNFNNHIGVPLTLLAIPEGIDIAIVEMGANQPGDIQELAEIALPDMGLITNVGHAHLEKLGDLNGVRKTKGALFDYVGANGGKIFVNEADPHVLTAAKPYGKQVGFGTPESAYAYQLVEQSMHEMELEVSSIHWTKPLRVRARLTGAYNCMNILAAIAVGVELGISREGIQRGIYNYLPQNNRSQMVKRGTYTIWLDAYNANPSSMKASIANIFEGKRSKVALILGDMYELGKEEEELHEEMGHFIQSYPAEVIIGVGPRMKSMVEAHGGENAHWFGSKEDLIPKLHDLLASSDTLLIKGSRSMAMEKLVEELPE